MSRLQPEDFTVRSTGVLRRQDDQIQAGDVVSVESWEITMSPRMLAALGVTPDMSQQEVNDQIERAWWQAAHQVDQERRRQIADELTTLNQEMGLL